LSGRSAHAPRARAPRSRIAAVLAADTAGACRAVVALTSVPPAVRAEQGGACLPASGAVSRAVAGAWLLLPLFSLVRGPQRLCLPPRVASVGRGTGCRLRCPAPANFVPHAVRGPDRAADPAPTPRGIKGERAPPLRLLAFSSSLPFTRFRPPSLQPMQSFHPPYQTMGASAGVDRVIGTEAVVPGFNVQQDAPASASAPNQPPAQDDPQLQSSRDAPTSRSNNPTPGSDDCTCPQPLLHSFLNQAFRCRRRPERSAGISDTECGRHAETAHECVHDIRTQAAARARRSTCPASYRRDLEAAFQRVVNYD
jgi:hypothetical protein